jgi:multidrug transporter EmrE-like cation transporter
MVAVAALWSVAISLDKLAIERSSEPLHAVLLFTGIGLASLGALAARGRLADLQAVREVPWSLPAALVVGSLALGLQFVALKGVLVGVLETVKRGIGNAAAVVLGRAVFGEEVTAGKVAGVLLMAVGVALVMLA